MDAAIFRAAKGLRIAAEVKPLFRERNRFHEWCVLLAQTGGRAGRLRLFCELLPQACMRDTSHGWFQGDS